MAPECILDVVTQFAAAQGWPGARDDDRGTFSTTVAGRTGRWVTVFYAQERERRLMVYSVLPLGCPVERRRAMMEALTRANYNLLVGNFELDLDDGEVRFKTSLDVEGDRLSQALLHNLIAANHQMMDQSLPALVQVVAGSAAPAEAIAAAESSTH